MRRRGAGFQVSRELWIKRGDGDDDRNGVVPRQLRQQVAVTCNEGVFRKVGIGKSGSGLALPHCVESHF